MSATKCTMLCQLATNVTHPDAARHRVGGWSESWYRPTPFTPAMQTDFERLCTLRAALLPVGAAVVGQRYQQVDPSAQGQSTARVSNGGFSAPSDIPQMSLLCRVKSASLINTKSMILRGIPDVIVVEGEIQNNNNFTNALIRFFTELGSWYFRGRDLSLPATPIVSITQQAGPPITGLVQCEQAHGLNPFEMVRVLRTTTDGDDFFGGRFQINSVPTLTSVVLSGWNGGNTTKGKIRRDAIVYPQVAPTQLDPIAGGTLLAGINVSRIITKKVGRPFDQYRGRR